MFTFHYKLPEGSKKAVYEAEFYQLKARKRVLYEDNREFRTGLRYLIWSQYARVFYERVLDHKSTTEEDISYYLLKGILYVYPTEQNREDILKDIKSSQLGYYTLMKRRTAEMDYERKVNERNDGNGYQHKLHVYKHIKDKYKIKKKK